MIRLLAIAIVAAAVWMTAAADSAAPPRRLVIVDGRGIPRADPGAPRAPHLRAVAAPRTRVVKLPRLELTARVDRPTGIAVFDRPGGRRLGLLSMRTEWGSRRFVPILRSKGAWAYVSDEVGGRQGGWILASQGDLTLYRRSYALLARRSAGTLTLLDNGHAIRTIRATFGRPGSPTPVGRFAVTDRISGAGFGGTYGCCILALSGRQPLLPSGWRGGDRLAIHSTDRPFPTPSAGCIVATDADLRYLMRRVPLGTPVTVRP